MYGMALTGLRQLLGLSRGATKDETIATVKLLGMFEVRIRQVCQIISMLLASMIQVWQAEVTY